MDNDGYPEPHDIEWLKLQLSDRVFLNGAKAIANLINATGYGKATITENPPTLTVATGGWSGCEEILSETYGTLWRILYWESSHRGGLEVFKENNDE